MKLRNKNTGEIGYLELEKGDDEKYISFRVYKNDFMHIRYNSLTKLIAEWEEYTPPEPLIKDEKIRKAVRAWADTLNVTKVYIKQIGSSVLCITLLGDEKYDDQFKIELPYSNHLGGFYYTIAELCGEEE